MKELENITKFSEFVFKLFQNVEKNDLEYIYRGDITAKLVSNILDLAKNNLENGETAQVKSRIYFIMGEGLQNITRHQENFALTERENNSIIVINKRKTRYTITTGNIIKNENIKALEEKLKKINSMSVKELRNFARFIRNSQGITEKGGASLGLVEMAKRSGNQLLYSFSDIDIKMSYFYFNTAILTTDNIRKEALRPQNKKYLDKIIEFHKYLNKENVLLTFKGDFNQENVVYLLKILRGQMPETTTSIKINNILIELLQNIEKHADNIDGIIDWKPGLFLISKQKNKYILSASNYISNLKKEFLEKKLSLLNSLDKKGIAELYKESILNSNEISSKKTGLGFIDIRKKSLNNFKYHFKIVSKKYSFFTVQATINIK